MRAEKCVISSEMQTPPQKKRNREHDVGEAQGQEAGDRNFLHDLQAQKHHDAESGRQPEQRSEHGQLLVEPVAA